jgi:hypothetical protein
LMYQASATPRSTITSRSNVARVTTDRPLCIRRSALDTG